VRIIYYRIFLLYLYCFVVVFFVCEKMAWNRVSLFSDPLPLDETPLSLLQYSYHAFHARYDVCLIDYHIHFIFIVAVA
jgi:hypothetical protein